jgi:hypothetical protein
MNRFRLLFLSVLLTLLTFSACVRSSPQSLTNQPNPYNNLVGTIVAQTLTAFPSATLQPNLTATFTQTPQGFISYYFDNINSRNYALTWSLLSDSFQNNLNGSLQDGYQVYVDFWNTVHQVTVMDAIPACQADLCAVKVTLRLDYYNGLLDTSIYPYNLTYDHARNTWLFDFIPSPTATPTLIVTATAISLLDRPQYTPGELVDYAAQTGDTLPALAAHFNTTIAEIRTANPQCPGLN